MKKRVLACGTFDLLHPGHRFFLESARALGTELVVIVARDATVYRIKGLTPFWNEDKRLEAVQALPEVTEAVLGDLDDFLVPVRALQPHLLALGYDQRLPQALEPYLQEHGIAIQRLEAFEPEVHKSSLLRKNAK